jgi:molecular chaperone GrpE
MTQEVTEENVESTEEDSNETKEETQEEELDPIEKLKKELEKAQEDTKEAQDKMLRLTAETENFKKRTQRESQDFRKFANESLIKQLLTVVDNLERAINSSADEDESSSSVVQGVEMTLTEMLKILENFNVKPIDIGDGVFDPNFHQAVMQEEADDVPENTIIRELQKGYMLHDRLLRPSMVVVSKAK